MEIRCTNLSKLGNFQAGITIDTEVIRSSLSTDPQTKYELSF